MTEVEKFLAEVKEMLEDSGSVQHVRSEFERLVRLVELQANCLKAIALNCPEDINSTEVERLQTEAARFTLAECEKVARGNGES